MIFVTKIFHFEMAHALEGYAGDCRHIHGHSYILHVTVTSQGGLKDEIPELGLIIDFKDLKRLVKRNVVDNLDHKLVLSRAYIKENPLERENLVIWENEPSAENILIYAKNEISSVLPEGVQLYSLKLYETRDSYAEWYQDLQD